MYAASFNYFQKKGRFKSPYRTEKKVEERLNPLNTKQEITILNNIVCHASILQTHSRRYFIMSEHGSA